MLDLDKRQEALTLEPEERRVHVKLLRDGNIDGLKSFLYKESSMREDGFKLISMHEVSRFHLDIVMEGTTLDVFQESARKQSFSMEVECIYKDGRTEICTFPRG